MNPFPSSSTAARLFTEIRREAGRPGLVFGGRDLPADSARRLAAAADEVRALGDEELLGGPAADRGMAIALRAGLLLVADRMEDSHELSQGLDTPEGSYWHGILHRREPDYGNARYWFRALGDHPLFDDLGPLPGEVDDRDPRRAGRWDPFRFIDLCEECTRRRREDLREKLEEVQEREILLLLAHCWRGAIGSGRQGGGGKPVTAGSRALLCLACAAWLSCSGRVQLREAMNEVQRKYVILFDEIERGSNLEARDAARDLRLALAAPGIAGGSPHREDPEFRKLLLEAAETAGRIETEAEEFDQERLTRLRGEVSRACRTCHARFRAVE